MLSGLASVSAMGDAFQAASTVATVSAMSSQVPFKISWRRAMTLPSARTSLSRSVVVPPPPLTVSIQATSPASPSSGSIGASFPTMASVDGQSAALRISIP